MYAPLTAKHKQKLRNARKRAWDILKREQGKPPAKKKQGRKRRLTKGAVKQSLKNLTFHDKSMVVEYRSEVQVFFSEYLVIKYKHKRTQPAYRYRKNIDVLKQEIQRDKDIPLKENRRISSIDMQEGYGKDC